MKTIRALVLHDVGKTEHLRLETLNMPELKPDHALVRVHYVALNHRDWWIVQGLYANIKTPCILGSDACGVVHSVYYDADASWVGKEVVINPSLHWGDSDEYQQPAFQILGMPEDGTFAEYVCVPVKNLKLKPEHLSREEAAALPLAGLTAYRALFTRGGCKSGMVVLITGIGGGVASLAFQMARSVGARIIVTSSDEEKLQIALKEGAVAAIHYLAPDYLVVLQKISQKFNGIDLIIDGAGGNGFDSLLQAVRYGGTIVSYGATRGKPESLDLRKIFWKQLNLKGSTMGSPMDFEAMLNLVRAHRIKPRVDSVYPLSQFDSAFRKMQEGSQNGKIVLRIYE